MDLWSGVNRGVVLNSCISPICAFHMHVNAWLGEAFIIS